MLHRHQRIAVAGSLHFVTTVTQFRGLWFIEHEICTQILTMLERCRAEHHLDCLGYVLMPDHLHVLFYQREDGSAVCDCMEQFKKWSARRLCPPQYTKRPLWRRRYDDVPLPGVDAAVRRLYYMHYNPVKRGLTSEPEQYPWSSAGELLKDQKGIITLRHL